jgi:hypothetical protein
LSKKLFTYFLKLQYESSEYLFSDTKLMPKNTLSMVADLKEEDINIDDQQMSH